MSVSLMPFERADALETTEPGGRVALVARDVADRPSVIEGVDVVRLPDGLMPSGILEDHEATSLVPVKFDLR